MAASGWEGRLDAALDEGSRFFMNEADVQHAAIELAKTFDGLAIPYAIAGAMALAAHGYRRFTSDLGVVLTREGLAAFKAARLGRGYVEKFAGSKGVRDTEHNVVIDILIAGEFPGDGRPKPVAFPDPATGVDVGARYRVVSLPKLVELKLASGMTAPHRLKDLADVLELVRAAALPLAFATSLDPYVRDKYRELWQAAQGAGPEE